MLYGAEAVTSGWLTDVLAAVLMVHLLQKRGNQENSLHCTTWYGKTYSTGFQNTAPFFYNSLDLQRQKMLTVLRYMPSWSTKHVLKLNVLHGKGRPIRDNVSKVSVRSSGIRLKQDLHFRLHALCCTPAQCSCMNKLPRLGNPTWRKMIPTTHSLLLRFLTLPKCIMTTFDIVFFFQLYRRKPTLTTRRERWRPSWSLSR